MQFLIKLFNNPYILVLNSIVTLILAFLTIRDKYLTFPHFKVEDINLVFFKEGILSVEFELINTSKVPLNLKHVRLICGNNSYNPVKINPYDYYLGRGELALAVKRKHDKNFAKMHIDVLKDFTLQYGEYKKLGFLYSTNDPEILSKRPILFLQTRSKKKKIQLFHNPVSML